MLIAVLVSAGMIGMRVNCLKCDRNEAPAEWALARASQPAGR